MSGAAGMIRVLHVDDDRSLCGLTKQLLEREDGRMSVETATSVSDGLDILSSGSIDCIVSDYEMPEQDGIEFLQRVREEYPDLPFVLFTGKGSEEIASEAISAGVTDYLQKEGDTSQYAVLANRIGNSVDQFRSKHALEESEKRLSLFIEQSPLGVIEWDDGFDVARLNDAAERILGYTEDELLGESWETIVPPSDEDAVSGVVDELLRGEGGYHSINENIRKDGTRIVCEWHNRVVTDEDENVVAIFSQIHDITDRREQRRELKKTSALLSTLFDALPVGVLAEDSSRNVLAVNHRLFELFGMTDAPEDVIGADCERLAEDVCEIFADPTDFVERTNELVDEQRSVDGEELRLEDGSVMARSHRPTELPDGEGHLWVYHDVTERRRRERRLEALNEMTQELMSAETQDEVAEIGVNAARDILGLEANAIHVYDEDRSGLVPIAATDAVRELVGTLPTFTGDDSIAWRVYERGEPLALDDVYDDSDVYNPETPVRSEIHLPIGEVGILIAGSPTPEAFDQQDLVLGEILAGNVATVLEQVGRTEEIRARENELARQNERLDEFASVVSHDLRNPLNVASGRLELLRDEYESEHIDEIDRAHTRMNTLIEDLLELARQGNRVSETEPVDLSELTQRCWRHVETENATVVTDTTRRIDADRSRLQQLLENLFRNAVEHGGDDVSVTVGEIDDGFYVEDDGPGISEDDREDVFTAGYSTTEGGSGFGLSIVKEIADAHGWEIRIGESRAGGARFEITGIDHID